MTEPRPPFPSFDEESALHDALIHADELQVGQENGPINHFHQLWTESRTMPGNQNIRTN